MSGSIPLPEVVTRSGVGVIPSLRSTPICLRTSWTRTSDRGPRLVAPVAIGLSLSGRPWNHLEPAQAWPTRVDPLLVSEPLAWREENACPTPGAASGEAGARRPRRRGETGD